ncbi:hypothetical protein SEA_UTZCHIPS_70 [Microbacterium phage UtzChips]|nr:hypothetical protein SEA_UTZCHIPS_70 [Microbacterium phage UtzChips]
MDKHTNPVTETTFATRKAAQEFANLRSMVDGKIVTGPFIQGPKFVVYSSDPS